MGFGDGSLGNLVLFSSSIVVVNQALAAAAFHTKWMSKSGVWYQAVYVLGIFLALAAGSLARGASIISGLLLVAALPVSMVTILFWGNLLRPDFNQHVRKRVALLAGMVLLMLAVWITWHVAPLVGVFKHDQALFKIWIFHLGIHTLLCAAAIKRILSHRGPNKAAALSKLQRATAFVFGMLAIAPVYLAAFIRFTSAIELMMILGLTYFISLTAFLFWIQFQKRRDGKGVAIPSLVTFHVAICFGLSLPYLVQGMIIR